ncbi:Plasmodium vivax Vir protein, putative [Plasmodium vivax]|nr:Plasmodium vivax Vir protein, putative [Plasmodium vivax]
MSSNKLNIAQLRKDYPFFTKIWTLYEEFEKHIDVEDIKYKYENTCMAKLGQTNRKNEKYVNFCIKLIRNLVPYSDYAKAHYPTEERCKSLNYWIYYNIDDLKNSQNFVNDIYKESKDLINGHKNKSICPNLYIETLKDSEKMIKLFYVQDNTDIILETLKNIGGTDYCSCEKYINECVNIYKDIKNQYCTRGTDNDINSETCSHLGTFDKTYTNFLFKNPQLPGELPSLTSTNDKYIGQCKTEQINSNTIPIQQNNPGTSQEFTVKTTVATMAGASWVLALLYKFTPAGRWIHSGLPGRGGKINNILLEDGADELLSGRPIHEDLISYNIGYETA